jgi:hypothetical protein
MTVLFVAGFMDARMMVVITAAITAERVAPSGVRVARLTGALALIAGLVMCVRAIGATTSGAACTAIYLSSDLQFCTSTSAVPVSSLAVADMRNANR